MGILLPVLGTADAVEIVRYLGHFNVRAGLGAQRLYQCPLRYRLDPVGRDRALSHADICDGGEHFIDCDEATGARFAEYLVDGVAVEPGAEIVSDDEIHVYLIHADGTVEDPSIPFLPDASALLCGVGLLGDSYELDGVLAARAEGLEGARAVLAMACARRDDMPPTAGRPLGEFLAELEHLAPSERLAAAEAIDPVLVWLLGGRS
jgi:hypothetical protein